MTGVQTCALPIWPPETTRPRKERREDPVNNGGAQRGGGSATVGTDTFEPKDPATETGQGHGDPVQVTQPAPTTAASHKDVPVDNHNETRMDRLPSPHPPILVAVMITGRLTSSATMITPKTKIMVSGSPRIKFQGLKIIIAPVSGWQIYSSFLPAAPHGVAGFPRSFEFEMIRFCVVRRKLTIRLVNVVGMFIKPIPSKTNTNLSKTNSNNFMKGAL